ncbi:LysM peptidoglycan-binding domain-containing protein [Peribacillus saganii]|uniref:LysM peptidoglycan-binding domain-containing protein n=1 Tax=Peribacillus saganii TaxID=2303992 RepID=A0A372LBD3_9BACI|nr:peptidoglycan DD-metalloendopeptidase family protein [Peribacillus saganii]RFU63141.1 LysM peptidoglycan-binding domain-containing protein [Peribacillus saganii]
MLDYGKRFLIVMVVAAFIGLLFIGGKSGQVRAEELRSLPEGWVWPSNGIISDHFGTRGGAHKGIDIAAPSGTKVVAASNGIVKKSYYSSTYGNVVFLNHDGKYETVYAHLEKRLVKEGDKVNQGEAVGIMGNTGRSRGVHLHFELHLDEWSVEKANALNPLTVLGKREERALTADTGANQEKFEDTQAVKNLELDNTIPKGKKEETYQATIKVSDSSLPQEDIMNIASLRPNYMKPILKEKSKKMTVGLGDTLYSISARYNISVERIKEINDLENNLIFPKQTLLVN